MYPKLLLCQWAGRQLDQQVTCGALLYHVISPLPQPLIISRVWLSMTKRSGAEKAVESTKWNIANVRCVLREYGTVAVVFHTVMSLGSLGTCYTIVNMWVWTTHTSCQVRFSHSSAYITRMETHVHFWQVCFEHNNTFQITLCMANFSHQRSCHNDEQNGKHAVVHLI